MNLNDYLAGLTAATSVAADVYTAKKNLEMQKETNAQNIDMLKQTWAREDTAVYRRSQDLKAAGLSPVLAAGSAASTMAPIQIKAPQLEKIGPSLMSALGVLQMNQNIAQSQEQIKLIREQRESSALENMIKLRDYSIYDKWGVPYTAPSRVKEIASALNALNEKGKPVLKSGLNAVVKIAPEKTIMQQLWDKLDKTVTGVESRQAQSDYYNKKIDKYKKEAYYRDAIESLKRRMQ